MKRAALMLSALLVPAFSIAQAPAGAGAPTGMDVERVGTYGTLYLNSATGAYSFVPNDAAINAVQAGANPSENFSFTVSDGAGGSDSFRGPASVASTSNTMSYAAELAPAVTPAPAVAGSEAAAGWVWWVVWAGCASVTA